MHIEKGTVLIPVFCGFFQNFHPSGLSCQEERTLKKTVRSHFTIIYQPLKITRNNFSTTAYEIDSMYVLLLVSSYCIYLHAIATNLIRGSWLRLGLFLSFFDYVVLHKFVVKSVFSVTLLHCGNLLGARVTL